MKNKKHIRLYIDIEGVIISKAADYATIANGAIDFLKFALEHFDCYWLTGHCRGRIRSVIAYLRMFKNSEILELAKQLKPTKFKFSKLEAIDMISEFIWLEDGILAMDKEKLKACGKLDSLIEVDTSERPDDLLRAKSLIIERFVRASE